LFYRGRHDQLYQYYNVVYFLQIFLLTLLLYLSFFVFNNFFILGAGKGNRTLTSSLEG